MSNPDYTIPAELQVKLKFKFMDTPQSRGITNLKIMFCKFVLLFKLIKRYRYND